MLAVRAMVTYHSNAEGGKSDRESGRSEPVYGEQGVREGKGWVRIALLLRVAQFQGVGM